MQNATRFEKTGSFFILFGRNRFQVYSGRFFKFLGFFVNLMFHTDKILMKQRIFRLFGVVFFF